MRLTRPRYTILSLMIVVLLASLALWLIVARREQRRRAIALQAAEAGYKNAILTREVAEITMLEYVEGIHPHDVQAVEGELAHAKFKLERVQGWIDAKKHGLPIDLVPGDLADGDEQAIGRARSAVEQALKKRAMADQIKERTVKDIQSEIDHAKADELARKAERDQLKAIGTRLFW
jgi:Bacterial signalling protein N terminal repeat